MSRVTSPFHMYDDDDHHHELENRFHRNDKYTHTFFILTNDSSLRSNRSFFALVFNRLIRT